MQKKRTIPRHVDGRVKVGMMTFKDAAKAGIIIIILLLIVLKDITPVSFFIFIAGSGIIVGLFSEFNNKETGIYIMKEKIRYYKEGNIYFERGELMNENKKLVQNEIKKRR